MFDTIFRLCSATDSFDKLWFSLESLVPDQVNLPSIRKFMNLDCSIGGQRKDSPDGLSSVCHSALCCV